MALRPQVVGLALLVSVLSWSLLGCNETEQKKVRLLNKVDSKAETAEDNFALGQIYENQGKWGLSIYYYDLSLRFNPSQRDMQAMAVKSVKDSGNAAGAKEAADRAIGQVSRSAAESIGLAVAFQKLSLDDYALTCYTQALTLAPNSSRTNMKIGYYYLSKNDKQRAKEYLARSFQINPGQSEVADELGRLGVPVKIPQSTGIENKAK
jgi:tetratricopeptide (TPR) repeat protein